MLADVRKSLVRESYDQEAERYRDASDMQLLNLTRLLSLSTTALQKLKAKRILDVGCGLGPAVAVLIERGLLDEADYLGLDLSPEMIAGAKKVHESERVKFRVGDAEAIELADGSVDLVLSNSALHWLNQPKFSMTPAKAFREMYRVLRPAGVLAVSTAAIGKAERFLKVYRTVLARWNDRSGFDSGQYTEDPINRLHLHELVDLALGANFEVEIGQLHYQPYQLPNVHAYLNAVRAYGFTSFMAPITPELRENVWSEVSQEYAESVGDGPYVHDYYVAYVIAHKGNH
ncbi:MAG: methyltransferase domain-containing protein [Rhodomicrobium sp.]